MEASVVVVAAGVAAVVAAARAWGVQAANVPHLAKIFLRHLVAMEFYPAKRVPPYNLWIGSERDSENTKAARAHGVTLVVNCTRTIPTTVPGVTHYRVPVDDTPLDADDMQAYLPRAVQLIDAHLRRGGGVLVHCYAGISRSASVAAAYLMYREGLTPRQAIARIRRAKPETFGPSPNFATALDAFHALLKKVK